MLKLATLTLLCLTLTGCATYRPLYGKGPDGTSVATRLSALGVAEQRTRGGQLVRNEILDGTTSSVAQHYGLKLDVTEHITDVSSLSTSLGGRKRLNLSAQFELYDSTSGKALTNGSSFSNVEYDVINIPVSDLSAANNARARAATELGQDIKLRLATFLATQKN